MKKQTLLLGVIQLIVAIGAIPAGYLFLIEPDGSKMGMTVDVLSKSPFKNFFIPGLFLFSINGILNLVCSFLSFYKYKYASLTGIALGSVLTIWVSVQVYFIGLIYFLQPTYFLVGLAEIALSIFMLKSERMRK
jgi:hypothetical protein